MQNLEKTVEIQAKEIHETNSNILTFLEKVEKESIISNKEEIIDIGKEKLQVLSV
jgi:hypothetical protein